MKVEMRWLERKTGKTLMNEWGYYYDETINVLQYRERYDASTVTQWQEVPIVKEEDES